MHMLNDFDFLGEYCKLDHDVAKEFYMPCMMNAVKYDRISGYFGSTIYIIAWDALKQFIDNGGKMRIMCSPYLYEEDAEAITRGVNAKTNELLKQELKKEIADLLEQDNLSEPARLLACLIAEDIIDIRILVAHSDANPDVIRLYHDKAGVFIDSANNAVGFRGSFNETFKGLSNDGNIESINVFQSWDGGKDAERIKNIQRIFDRVWNKEYSSVDVYELPDEVREYIRKETSGYNWKDLLDEITVRRTKAEKWNPNKTKPLIELKKHQTDALEAWEKKEYRAIYQGCTGCGKTVIAISAIRKMLDTGKTVLVLVPSKILLYHWRAEIIRLISDMDIKFMLCGDGNNSWRINDNLRSWTAPSSRRKKIIIAMMDTAVSDEFRRGIYQGEHLVVIADEVHRMGSASRRRFFEIYSGPRLGLSATPERYGDPEGTQSLIDYFGSILFPPYTLENAIKDKVLTPYFYHPESISLTADEQEEWDEISKAIAKRYAVGASRGDDMSNDSFFNMMRIKRARIIKKAKNKIRKALEIIDSSYKPGQKWLVYCEDRDQLTEMSQCLLNKGYNAFVYYAGMPGDRDATLEHFGRSGGILVSIKCLDEGVDIPSTTHALVLASSKNPREFIQRRGRILRKADKKYFSQLYDLIAVPDLTNARNDKSLSIILSELARAIEFGKHAQNPSCITALKIITVRFGVDYADFLEGGYEEDEEQLG